MDTDFSDAGKIGAIYTRLKAALLSNAFRPGARLLPDEIAGRFGVSRTPVREALQRLAMEHLIACAGRTMVVKSYDLQEMTDLYELALMLLKTAVEKNIAGFTMQGVTKPMRIEFDERGQLRDNSDEFTRSHAVFIEQIFERIIRAAKNEEMLRTILNFNDRTRALRVVDLREGLTVRLIAAGMFALLDKLEAQDVKGACANLDEQFAAKVARLPESIAQAEADRRFAPLP